MKFKTTVNEKEKYEQMNENCRDIRENSGNVKIFQKYIFFFCMCKMVEITKETWERNGVELIVFHGKKWLSETNIKDRSKHSILADITLQYPPRYRKQRQEL